MRGLLAHPFLRRVLALDSTKPAPEDDEDATTTGGTSTPWEQLDESRPQGAMRAAGRVVFWLAVVVVGVSGLRSIFGDGAVRTVVEKPAATSTFPEGEAQAVAARFAGGYLSLPAEGEEAKESRLKVLRRDSPADLGASWDGTGTQQVLSVLPGEVNTGPGATGTVQVLAQVAPKAKAKPDDKPADPKKPAPSKKAAKGAAGKAAKPPAKKPAPAEPSRSSTSTPERESDWLALSVPVKVQGTRVIVTGAPVFTSVPPAGDTETEPAPSIDAEFSTRTRSTAEAFFTAWASGDARTLSAATAPGADLAPLRSLTFEAVTEWSVYAPPEAERGSGKPAQRSKTAKDRRTARAVVTWRLPGGAKFTQQYSVQLRAVRSGDVRDWRVVDATASTTTTTSKE